VRICHLYFVIVQSFDAEDSVRFGVLDQIPCFFLKKSAELIVSALACDKIEDSIFNAHT
jgi:hypothetical protein